MFHREASARCDALGQMLAGFVDGPVAFLAAFLELPHARLKVAQPLLALGQLDLDLGGFAVGRQPLAFQLVDLLAELARVRLPFRPARRRCSFRFSRASVKLLQGGVVLLLRRRAIRVPAPPAAGPIGCGAPRRS